jgi:hypothetical protein
LFVFKVIAGPGVGENDKVSNPQDMAAVPGYSSNLAHGKVYVIQHYVIKFVSDLRQVGGFLRVLRFAPPIKLTTTI